MSPTERPTARFLKPLVLAAICFAVLTAALPLFVAYGHSRYGAVGLQAALTAYGICLGASWVALLVAGVCHTPHLAVAGVLASMLVRMGVPMAAMVLFQSSDHPLLAGGVDGLIVAYYLLMLAVEAPLSILLVRPNPTPTTGAS